MIAYITLGTNDLAAAATFYDPLVTALGGKSLYRLDHLIGYGFEQGAPLLVLTQPENGQPAAVGNGTMVALAVDKPAEVDRLHATALSLGATDEGAPGLRGGSFYGGYFRCPEGHKFNLHVPQQAG